MKQPEKEYDETLFKIILSPEQRRQIEEIREMANVDYGDAFVMGIWLYHTLLEETKKNGRIVIEHRFGKNKVITL